MDLSQTVLINVSPKWMSIVYQGETKTMLDAIVNTIDADDTINILPARQDWFAWCRMTPLDAVKIIIYGQDPYHKAGWAHGMAFSCLKNAPSTLRNIYKALVVKKHMRVMTTHGDLSAWATQGVLLLNGALTVQEGRPRSHTKIWAPYIKEVTKRLCAYYYDSISVQLIFMIWGRDALKFGKVIDEDFHIIMKYTHPSTIAQRSGQKFIKCDHFTQANCILVEDGRDPIQWGAVVPEVPINTVAEILHPGPKHHIIFTDGSCYPNNKSNASRAGYAMVFVSGPMSGTVVCGNLSNAVENTSNIRAEGMAIIRSLDFIAASDCDWNYATIITDCQFWINMIENYMPKWTADIFAEKSNPDMTVRMWSAYKNLASNKIKFRHVRSHNKSGWREYPKKSFERFCYDQNDRVDHLCSDARTAIPMGTETITKE
jgi:uracil-DNA glycosylase